MSTKTDFLEGELWILAWNASVQRAQLYRKDVEERRRRDFRDSVVCFLRETMIPGYRNEVAERQHCENIEKLMKHANGVGVQVLGDKGYKYGVAQKLMNLGLKYYWCMDLINEPPHCPVDRIVIEQTKLRGRVNWTQIGTREKYLEVIEAMRKAAGSSGKSIARWELETYRRR